MQLSLIHSIQELEAYAAVPHLLIYKNSNACTNSAAVYNSLLQWNYPIIAKIVTVQLNPNISLAITQKWQIPHATPQLIFLRYGQVTKFLSNYSECYSELTFKNAFLL